MRGSSDRARLPRLLSSNSGRGVSRSGGRLRLTTVGAAYAPPVFCTNGLLPCFRRRGGRAAYSLSTEFVRRAALALIPEVRAEISPHLREPRLTRRLRLPRHDDRPHWSGFRPQATRTERGMSDGLGCVARVGSRSPDGQGAVRRSISTTRNASSRACCGFNRGSHTVSYREASWL
jgi:hypothetical protein